MSAGGFVLGIFGRGLCPAGVLSGYSTPGVMSAGGYVHRGLCPDTLSISVNSTQLISLFMEATLVATKLAV